MTTQKDIAALRDYYDNTSTAEDMEGGTWETDVDPDPMITTSVRLPKSVLDRVRAQAKAEGIKPTALMRRWVEQASAPSAQLGAGEAIAGVGVGEVLVRHSADATVVADPAVVAGIADVVARLRRLEQAVFPEQPDRTSAGV